MILKQLLLEFIPSNEIKSRLKNKQIKVNNEVIDNFNIDIPTLGHYEDFGDFLFWNITDENKNALKNFNVRDFFGGELTNINKLDFLTGYILISVSKKEEYVFFINE